jgi:AAA15 family ATPase/GTPase
MIKKVVIKNYRIFQDFKLDLQSGMNIIVGDNDCGKSTLLEAVGLALTNRLRGKMLTPLELTPYPLQRASYKNLSGCFA